MSEPYIGDLLRKQGEFLEEGTAPSSKTTMQDPRFQIVYPPLPPNSPAFFDAGCYIHGEDTVYAYGGGVVIGLTNFPNRNSGVEADEPIIVDASKVS